MGCEPGDGVIAGAVTVDQVDVVANQRTVVDSIYREINLSDLRRTGDGEFQMTLNGEIGRVYAIEWSNDVIDWAELLTLTNRTGSTNIIDHPLDPWVPRYYRVREW